MVKPSPRSRSEATQHGGPRSALRLVEAGEDPRILSTNPDDFFSKPWTSASVLLFSPLLLASLLAVGFTAIEAWVVGPYLPWYGKAGLLIFPWLFLAPLWSLWIRQKRHDMLAREGRKAIAAIVNGTAPERGQATWVAYDESPATRRGLDVLVVADSPHGEAVFINARSTTRPSCHKLFGIGDPVWIWRSEDGWVFGQITQHGLDPAYSPADEPQPPTWEAMHGGHSPGYFVAGLSELAAQYRAGALTLEEYKAAEKRLLDIR